MVIEQKGNSPRHTGKESKTMNMITATRDGWTATYRGGAYIDLHLLGQCIEAINVLDYATGEYMIEPTQEAVARELADWLDENADNLGAYIEHARYM